MKLFLRSLIMLSVVLFFTGCSKKESVRTINPTPVPRQSNVKSRPTQIVNIINNIEKYHDKRIRIVGNYINGEIPSVKLLNLSTANKKGIVYLKFSDQVYKEMIAAKKIKDGDQITATGLVKTEGLTIPELSVEKIQKSDFKFDQ